MNEGHVYHAVQDQQEVFQTGEELRPCTDMLAYFEQYARERPEVMALWCFGIGFVLGWKLKPW